MIRPIFDPEVLPVEATGADLATVALERLQPEGLRQRFAQLREWTPETFEDRISPTLADPRQAAVLIPLVVRESGLTVLLTQRTAHLTDHAGQVSFPGGGREPDDLDPAATALREAREEVGLEARHVEVLGSLPDYLTGTGFRVTPVVGLVHPPFSVQASEFEVAEIFEVPLNFLMTPANHQTRLFKWEGGERRFFAMPFVRPDDAAHFFIWGATAGMLRNLYRFLAA